MAQNKQEEKRSSTVEENPVWLLGKTLWRHQMFLRIQLTGISQLPSPASARLGLSPEQFLETRLEMAN